MPNSKELELERQAMLRDMAVKIDVIYELLRQATIASTAPKGKKDERKNSKKIKKTD